MAGIVGARTDARLRGVDGCEHPRPPSCTVAQPSPRASPRARDGATIGRMRIQSVTVGVPSADLSRSVEWYRTAFELDSPDLEPSDGVVEFKLGPVWLQLGDNSPCHGAGRTVLRLGVTDVSAERERLVALGLDVGEMENVDNVIEYFDFADPDGNRLGLYTEVEP